MMEKPMDVLEQFPVRKSKKQKQAFRDAVGSYLSGLGYDVTVEERRNGVRNVVAGDVNTAKYLVTAHYDTPASIGLPNILTPCNPVTFILWQLLLVGFFMVAAIASGVLMGLLMDDPQFAGMAAAVVYWGLLILLLCGPANKNNANDNTSGVVTVLEIARTLPENRRDNVCFVLFDMEEAGLVGSATYRKAHKDAVKDKLVLNMDCVGDGDEILLVPTKKLKKDADRMGALSGICRTCGEKSIRLHRKGFCYYPSDQKNFPYGVGIAAFRRKKGIGLYVSRIHTRKDTVLEETNVNILRSAITTLICQ